MYKIVFFVVVYEEENSAENVEGKKKC